MDRIELTAGGVL